MQGDSHDRTPGHQPRARSAWHSHPLGQILIVTAGTGRVQQWGGPVHEVRRGDVVRIPPNTKHWHGAAPETSMAHIAIVEVLDGRSTEWMEQVSEAQYAAPVDEASTPATEGPTAAQRIMGDIAPALADLTYSGWPDAVTAVGVAREVFADAEAQPRR